VVHDGTKWPVARALPLAPGAHSALSSKQPQQQATAAAHPATSTQHLAPAPTPSSSTTTTSTQHPAPAPAAAPITQHPGLKQSAASKSKVDAPVVYFIQWSGPRLGGLALRLRGSWGTEVRGWSSLALAAWADFFIKLIHAALCILQQQHCLLATTSARMAMLRSCALSWPLAPCASPWQSAL
jgi:hypothetical protein